MRELLGTLFIRQKVDLCTRTTILTLCTDSILDSVNYAGNHKKMGCLLGYPHR